MSQRVALAKKGCKVKAKAFAGAYAKVDMSRSFGTEQYNAQIGGSVIIGAGAGAGGHVSGSYSDGKVSFGGEVCVQVIVGLCGNFEVEIDVGPLEDLVEDFAEEMAELGGEAVEGLIELGTFLAPHVDALFDDATETLTKGAEEVMQGAVAVYEDGMAAIQEAGEVVEEFAENVVADVGQGITQTANKVSKAYKAVKKKQDSESGCELHR